MKVVRRDCGASCVALFSFLAFAGVILFAPGTAHAQRQPGLHASAPTFAPGQVLVQFKPEASDDELQDALTRAGLNIREHLHTGPMKAASHPGIAVALTKMPVLEAIRVLQNHPGVAFAEPNWIYTHQTICNDPYYANGYTWGLYGDATSPGNEFGSQAAEAWAAGYTGSRSVYVGVVDEGIEFTHPDLNANVWSNPFDIPGDGIDNDSNGYVDDIHGWDFYGRNNSVYDGTGDDHGTHVTGTIAAAGGNGFGVAGINWNVTYISGKFLGPNGGYTSDAIKAIDYFTDLKQRHGLNIVALNNSWGGGGYSQGLHDAIIRAAKAGILFVAAAGNAGSNNDTTPNYPSSYDTTERTSTESPAAYDSVIAVAAIDSAGNLASWSCYGANTVHLGAPGVGIWSTVPTDTYASYSGTSMATPHVTGAVALYSSTHPDDSAAKIRAAILNSALPTASLAGKTTTGGRLNLSSIIAPESALGTLSAPTGLSVLATSDTRITLDWTDNSTEETGFKIERSTDNFANVTVVLVGPNATSYADNGLSAGTTYSYRARAYDATTDSDYSNVATATTQSSPPPPSLNAPGNLSAAAASSSQINLSWSDNSSNESGFKIERATDSAPFAAIATLGANVRTFSSTGLQRNKRYYFRARAFNASSYSAYSNQAMARTTK